MEIATIKVNTVTACVKRRKPIPRGLVGGTVRIHYADPIWNDLNKTVVFRGADTRDVLNVTDTVQIPWETVAKAGRVLYIGFYGSNADGTVVVPTIWTELGMIQGAADPSGDISAEPTQDVWEQMQAMIGDLGKLDTQSKASIVDAVNETLAKADADLDAVKSVNGIAPDENGNVQVDAQPKMLVVTATRNLDDTITASHSSEEVAAFVESGGVPVINCEGSWYWYEGGYGSAQYFVRYLNTYQGLLMQERFKLLLDKTATVTFSNDGVFLSFLDEFVDEKLGVIENGAY